MAKTKKNKKKHGGKTVRTDAKKHLSFTLHNFIITNSDGEIDDDLSKKTISELHSIADWMSENERLWVESGDYEKIAREFIENYEQLSKRYKAAQMREYVDSPKINALSHEYNMMEMLRLNLASTLDLSITMIRIEEVLSEYADEILAESKPSDIRQKFIEKYCKDGNNKIKVPSASAFRRHISSWIKSKKCYFPPSPSGKVPFHATDGHYRHFTADGKMLHLALHLSFGVAVLHWKIPDKSIYRGNGKYTCPVMRRDKSGTLIFDFTYDTQRPHKKSADEVSGFVASDAGIVETATSTFVAYDGYHSQPLCLSHVVKNYERRISALHDEVDALGRKAVLCESCGRWDKAESLYNEARAKRLKISKLKRQKSVHAAREVVSYAMSLNAGVALEDLSWIPECHWDQAFLQDKIVELAADRGLPVVRVSAAGTSRFCPHCSGKMKCVGGRKLVCCECGRVVDRDVSASRVVGVRAVGVGCLSGFRYRLCCVGSRSDRLLRDVRARGISDTIAAGGSSTVVRLLNKS